MSPIMQSPKDSTPSPRATDNNSNGNGREAAVAKTAGLLVFSGIAISILKALNPLNKNRNETTQPLTESTQPTPPPSQPQQLIVKPITCAEKSEPESKSCTIEIVKGDTLWGLSRKYGVSIDAIKEANGLSGDTIYTGKKLIIP